MREVKFSFTKGASIHEADMVIICNTSHNSIVSLELQRVYGFLFLKWGFL